MQVAALKKFNIFKTPTNLTKSLKDAFYYLQSTLL